LPGVHLPPIHPVVYGGSYPVTRWETSSLGRLRT